MNKKELNIVIFFFLCLVELYAGDFQFWNQQSFNGSLLIEGVSRAQQNKLRNGKSESPVTQALRAELKMHSAAYIIHPSFIKLNAQLKYNPGVQNQQFVVLPNRTETLTAEQIRFQSTFYDKRPLSFNLFTNVIHNFVNRDFAGRVEGFTTDYGASLSYRNKVVPLSFSYLNSLWKQEELESGRKFNNNRRSLNLEINKSFFKKDVNRLRYQREDYDRLYTGTTKISNSAQTLFLKNNHIFDDSLKRSWNSTIQYRDQGGSQAHTRFQLNEQIMYGLLSGFKLIGRYSLNEFRKSRYKIRQQHLVSALEHQLFLSLRSRLFYEYTDVNHSAYREGSHQAGVRFDYQKKIPSGNINLSYEGRMRADDRNSSAQTLLIFAEEHVLSLDKVELLDNSNIDPASIKVFDQSGVLIYQQNLDYVIIERGEFVEIQRVAGGQIPEGAAVWIDYSVVKNHSYRFNSNSNSFQIRVSVFNKFLEPYFRLNTLNYHRISKSEQKILKTMTQRIYGLRISKSMFSTGIEFENYDSNLLPYRSQRFFFSSSKTIFKKLNTYLRANWRNHKLTMINDKQRTTDLSVRLSYPLSSNSQLSMDGGYRFQQGRGIDLKLSNFRTEWSARFRAVYLAAGIEIYQRNYIGERVYYQGGYIKVERKF